MKSVYKEFSIIDELEEKYIIKNVKLADGTIEPIEAINK